jgi:hypothetical protein
MWKEFIFPIETEDNMNLITKWLNGVRNYYVGCILYNYYGTDPQLKKYFTGHRDQLKHQKLVAELSKLESNSINKPAAFKVPMPDLASAEMASSTDPVLDAIHKEWNAQYQRMQYLRHELDKYPGNTPESIAARSKLAGEILELEQICMLAWSKRDYYIANNALPAADIDDIDIPSDPIELGALLESLKRNVRRNVQLAKQNPTKSQYAARAKAYQLQLDRILNATKHV